jgi:8-oxo-dGTP diphosphatase
MTINRFNIRVYFIVLQDNQVLVSDEMINGKPYTKFPGGGLEFGEGTIDCVKREAMEELGVEVADIEHLYTTDFFQQSYFHESDQVISVYYKVRIANGQSVKTSEMKFDFAGTQDQESFRWVSLSDLMAEDLSFPIDKLVVPMIAGGCRSA